MIQSAYNGRKLPKSKKKDVLSRGARDLIIERLNPLQEITARIGTKNYTSYSPEKVDIEIDGSNLATSSTTPGQSESIFPFLVGNVVSNGFNGTQLQYNGDGSTSSLGFFFVAAPAFLRAAPYPGAVIVPGLASGMIVYAANVGTAATGLATVWLWLNSEGMAWGTQLKWKDANTCQLFAANFVMTQPKAQ